MMYCDCNGPAWPKMMRIRVGGILAHFYLCRQCRVIRENECRPDGTLTGNVHYHELNSGGLPSAVVEQVRDILDTPNFSQLSLFSDIRDTG